MSNDGNISENEEKIDGEILGVNEDEREDSAEDEVSVDNEVSDGSEDTGKDENTDVHEDSAEDEAADNGEDADESEDSSESDVDVEGTDSDGEKPKTKVSVPLINPAYNRQLPISLLAGLIGAILGPIPAVLLTYFTGAVFYPLFVVAPLLAYLFNKLLKGGRDIRALIAVGVFSLLSAYTTAVACRAALYVLSQKISVLEIPLLVALAFGRSGVIPDSASAYAYPLVFTALGLFVTWELLRAKEQGLAVSGQEPAEENTEIAEPPDPESTDD